MQKLSNWLPSFVHTDATKSKSSFTLTGGKCKTCGFVRWGQQNQAFSKIGSSYLTFVSEHKQTEKLRLTCAIILTGMGEFMFFRIFHMTIISEQCC